MTDTKPTNSQLLIDGMSRAWTTKRLANKTQRVQQESMARRIATLDDGPIKSHLLRLIDAFDRHPSQEFSDQIAGILCRIGDPFAELLQDVCDPLLRSQKLPILQAHRFAWVVCKAAAMLAEDAPPDRRMRIARMLLAWVDSNLPDSVRGFAASALVSAVTPELAQDIDSLRQRERLASIREDLVDALEESEQPYSST